MFASSAVSQTLEATAVQHILADYFTVNYVRAMKAYMFAGIQMHLRLVPVKDKFIPYAFSRSTK